MSTLDWIVIAIIGITAWKAYHKGFISTVFEFTASIVSFVLSYATYKPVSVILRSTGIYEWMKKYVLDRLLVGVAPAGLQEQTKLIQTLALPIPYTIKDGLIRNNNPEVYRLLGVDTFKDYIGGYIANLCLNMIAFLLVWFVIKAILYIVGESLRIVAKLPIIHLADQWAGLGIGVIKGCIAVWIGATIVALLVAMPVSQKIIEMLSGSIVAKWFYENNIIVMIINQLFV